MSTKKSKPQSVSSVSRKKRNRYKVFAVVIVLAFFAGFLIAGFDSSLSVSEITVDSEKIDSPVKIALISDLHSCRYGDGQAELIKAVDDADPDLVCLVGDIFDNTISDDNAEAFLSGICGRYPCCYVTGNHEYAAGEEAFRAKMAILEKYGIVRLSAESTDLEIRGQKITLCGADDPCAVPYDSGVGIDFWSALDVHQKELPDDRYTILLSHRPEYFSDYADRGFDLILCGHAHGGQWRIPGLLNQGFYAPGQGLFPKHTSGKFEKENSVMVVSRGLAKENTAVPRFYNKPEIVIIELK